MSTETSSPLALLGGDAAWPDPVKPPAWPPVSQATAEKLTSLYLSRKWSFNSPTEQAFEQAFADYHDARHGIFMVNGTVTMQCALGALGVGPGDEVLVPAMTWMSTAMVVHYVGATPVFVDVDPDTLCLDVNKAREAITPRTRAMIPVHLYGSMADLDALLDLASRFNLGVVEDCAHMHGGKWRDRGVGSWGDVGSFSFQQTKPMASGEGGICITNDDELADLLYRQKHIGYGRGLAQGQAQSSPPPELMCHNFRATAFQALLLNEQLEQLPTLVQRFEEARDLLSESLADVPGIRMQERGRHASPQGCYALAVIFDREPVADVAMDKLFQAMAAEGVGLARPYGPVYQHPLYNMPESAYRIADGGCPVAEHVGGERTAIIFKEWLVCDDDALRQLAKVIKKVAEHATDLRDVSHG